MRFVSHAVAVAVVVAVVLVVASASRAHAQPRRPNAAQQTELDKLDAQLTKEQTTQATFAAAKTARKLYELQRTASGDEAPETQRRLQLFAGLLSQIGDYPGAIALNKQYIAVFEKQKGVESREVLYALMGLIGPYYAQSRFDELEPVQQRILALTKKLDGEQSRGYAGALMQYGTLLTARNEYSSAQRVFEQALKLNEAILPSKTDLGLLGPLQVLAGIYWQTNQRPKAIQLNDRLIALVQAQPTANVQMIAGTMWGVAAMYHYGGRDDLAAPLTKKVIELFTAEISRLEKDKPDDPTLPALVGQLGFQYRQQGDLANAERLITQSVQLDEKRGAYSGWVGSLAELKRAGGKPKEALALLEKAQADLVKISPQSAAVYSTTIADVLREIGDFKRAEQLLLQHLVVLERQYSKRHPIYGYAQLSLAYVYMAAGRIKDAERVLSASLDSAERELAHVLKTGTEADHAVYFGRNSYQLDTAINFQLSYAPASGSAGRLGLTTLLRRKGRVLDAAAANLATIRAKLSPEDKKLLDDLAAARATLAKLTVAGPTATGKDDYAKEVAALEDTIQRLEVSVGKKSAAYRAVTQAIDLASVQAQVPKAGRLVEFVNYQPGDPKAPYSISPKQAPRRYAVYVVGPKGDPTLVDLGPAQAIDDAIEKFRKAVADPASTKVADLGNKLYQLTMAKVVPALGGATELLIAPDGALNVVPFSALVDDKQEFLIKRYTFTYLTSGRDLLRLKLKSKAQGGGVMFADPSFDAGAPAAKQPRDAARSRGRRSSDLASLMWPPLPGTGQEADEIEKQMRGLTVYRGKDATETTLKRVRGPKILHLATHGFFLADEAGPASLADAARAGTPPPPGAFENPLLRSGLALAGANKLVSGDDDGILTAMEATGLDLWGTKLVVLSACETGVGKVTNGDGVYGLRRALVIAGAESLVMSLWQVDDFATKELMAGYYGKLQAGKPRSSALRDIQLALAAQAKYAHPFYWAAFLPAGDTSPLGR